MHISVYAPNGQFGCLWLKLGALDVCVGFVSSLFGVDILWHGRFIYSTSPL